MRKIKISNTKERTSLAVNLVQKAIDAIQSNKVRFPFAEDIFRAVDLIEERLKKILYKRDWVGLKFVVQFGNSVGESTFASIERSRSGWKLIDLKLGVSRPDEKLIRVFCLQGKVSELAEFAEANF